MRYLDTEATIDVEIQYEGLNPTRPKIYTLITVAALRDSLSKLKGSEKSHDVVKIELTSSLTKIEYEALADAAIEAETIMRMVRND
jgi:hypothetical protein